MIRIAPLALMTAAVMTPLAPARAQDAFPADGTLLRVVAEGSTTRTPDLAEIQAGVVTAAPTAAEAMRQNAAKMADVLAALRKAGVAERDIQTRAINLSPQYRYQENKAPEITGYQAANQVTVRFRDVVRSGAILDALVAQGANDISGPTLGLADDQAAMDEARRDAIARARARATLYAQAAGLKVDRILAISEGEAAAPPRPMPMMMARAEAAPQTAIAPGEQRLTATVTVQFLLK